MRVTRITSRVGLDSTPGLKCADPVCSRRGWVSCLGSRRLLPTGPPLPFHLGRVDMPATLKTQRYPSRPTFAPGATVTVVHDDGPVDVVVSWVQPVRDEGRWVHGTDGRRDVVWWATW